MVLLKKINLLSVLFGTLLSVQAIGQNLYSYHQQPNCCYECTDCWWSGLAIYGDWLYWRARTCDLDYAAELTPSDQGPTNFSFATGKLQHVDPSSSGGYRVGALLECGCFFYDGNYTHFHDREKERIDRTIGGPGFGGLVSTQIPYNLLDNVGVDNVELFIPSAQADWELNYDVVDILAGYDISSRCCLQTFIFGGLKLAQINQNFDLLYGGQLIGIAAMDGVDSPTVEIEIVQKVDLNAYGVDLGFGIDYSFCNFFNFFGNFSYDILMGYFRRSVSQSLTLVDGDVVFLPYIQNIHENCWAPFTVANLQFGLGYKLQNLFFSVGYEFHLWMNMLSFLKVQDSGFIRDFESRATMSFDKNLQNFGLDGLFVRVGIGF